LTLTASENLCYDTEMHVLDYFRYWFCVAKSWMDSMKGANWQYVDLRLAVGAKPGLLPSEARIVINVDTEPDGIVPSEWIKTVIHHPCEDGVFPGMIWLDMIVDILRACTSSGWTVYLHCHSGISRSGMVACAYVMKTKGLTRDHALDYLRQARPDIAPNPVFMDALLEYEYALQEWNPPHERAGP